VAGRSGQDYISPTVQREAISAYAAELGGTITEWFTDEDYSGGTVDRPAFQAALAKSRAGDADGLVVMRIDRFARTVPEGAAIARELVDMGQVFASCQERIDPRTPTGRYMLTAFLANGELFLDQMKASWKVAKRRAVERGAPIGPTPFGYLRVKSPAVKPNQISPVEAAALVGGEPAVGTVIPDPVTGPLVAEVFRRSAAGESVGEIAEWLRGRYVPEGRRPFSGNEVRRWLTNRFYLGEIHYGELAGHVQPLVDARTFDAAQPGPSRAKRRGESLPLAGLLRCENCGVPMSGNRYGGRGTTPVYRCGTRCGAGAVITASLIEGFIFGLVRDAMAGFQLAGSRGDVAALDDAVTVAERELDAFVGNLTVRASLGEAKWEQGIKRRADALGAARAEREAAVRADRLLSVDLSNPAEHDLRGFAFAVMDAVYVGRGRGLDRVRVVWAGQDGEP
jgi:DNA invertase Pin-like site-specific DNA recombinase